MLEPNKILQQRYKLKQKLAQNAGRQTWLAEDISIQPAETVIIKFLSFGENFQWQDLKLFEREADILKQICHPRIPKYRDYFALEDKYNWFSLVEQYIPGDSLRQLVETKKRFTEEELRKIASEVLEILCYLHTLNPQVIHRDIKPSNLIIGEEKKVYLIDFGAVQDSVAAQGTTFTVVGTYGYAPIEQFGGRTVPASDLYALGATLIHLATGRIPADLPQTKMRIQFRDKVSLSDNFINWIEKLTEPDIDDRFTTASVALAALNILPTISYSHNSDNNIAVNSSAKVFKPQDTRVILQKSHNLLMIEVPEHVQLPKNFLLFFVLLCLIFSFLVPLEIIFLVILCFIIFLPIIITNHTNFHLSLNQKNLVMEWKFSSFTIKSIVCEASKIKSIKKDCYYRYENKLPELLIEADSKTICFSENLEEAEIDWLVQEIKDWLGIQ